MTLPPSLSAQDEGGRSNLYRPTRRSDYSPAALGFDDNTGLEEDLTILVFPSPSSLPLTPLSLPPPDDVFR